MEENLNKDSKILHKSHSHEHDCHSINGECHCHEFHITKQNEKRTLFTILFTLFAMVVEIIYALLSDGYHMATHLFALGITYITYIIDRRLKFQNKLHINSNKISALGAFVSSLFLMITGIFIIVEGVERLLNPEIIKFNEAIMVAVLGLIINGICIILMEMDIHSDNKEANNTSINHHEDCNFKAAYYHILADVITSIFAIIALLLGKYFKLYYLDAVCGVIGAILILKWAKSLLTETTKTLIDLK